MFALVFALTFALTFVVFFVPRLHAAQQIAQSLPVIRWQPSIALHPRDRLVDDLAPTSTGEHLLADRLHNRARKNTLDHPEFHVVGRVVEHAEFGLGRARKERASRILAKILGDDDRGGRLALAHGYPCGVQRGWLYVQVLVAGELRDQAARGITAVLINHQHWYL